MVLYIYDYVKWFLQCLAVRNNFQLYFVQKEIKKLLQILIAVLNRRPRALK
jgi:hypothetical protein